MSKAVIINHNGDCDVLKYVNYSLGKIKLTQVLIRHTVIGLNRYDSEQRNGLRKVRKFPFMMGVEGVGIIEAVGEAVINFKIGDRVGYCTAPSGAYCEKRVIDQKYLIKIPKDITDEVAAASLFKGMTAHYLTHRIYHTQPKTFALVNGANGALARILCQWANYRGCKVIGTVSSDDKVEVALKNGCLYVLNYNNKNFIKEIMKITNNVGVNVVYDSIGLLTSRLSFESLSLFGLYISYGQISGSIPNLNLSMLNSKSLFVTSPSIYHYKRSKIELSLTAMEFFEVLRRGYINIEINKKYKFTEIKKAHQDIEDRKVSGFNIIVI